MSTRAQQCTCRYAYVISIAACWDRSIGIYITGTLDSERLSDLKQRDMYGTYTYGRPYSVM